MALLQAISKAIWSATSYSAGVDLLATDLTVGSPALGASLLAVEVTLGAAGTFSIITKTAAGVIIGSSMFERGSSLNANAAYGYVYAVRQNRVYNFQLGASTTIQGQVDEIWDGLR